MILEGTDSRITFTDDDVVHPDLPLLGTRWVFGGLFNPELGEFMWAALASATIAFAEDGTFSVDTGCNQGSGTVTIEGSTLTVVPGSWSGRSCSADFDEAENEFLEVFRGELEYSIDGGSLTLTRADGHGLRLSDRG